MSNGNRNVGRSQVRCHELEPLDGLCRSHIRKRAQKLVATEANYEVIGAKMGADRTGYGAQELSPAAWPSESFVSLRPSTSTKVSVKGWPIRFALAVSRSNARSPAPLL